EYDPMLSPDGHWLAHAANETGTTQVYVQPYPGLDARHQVSINGGANPVWSRDGRTLFFVEGIAPSTQARDMRLFSVDVTLGPRFSAGIPRLVLNLPAGLLYAGPPVAGYDVTPDGNRFLGAQIKPAPPQPVPTEIQLTFN